MAAVSDLVADSDELDVDLVGTPEPEQEPENDSPPRSALSYRFRESPETKPKDNNTIRGSTRETSIAVVLPPPERRWEYTPFNGDTTVESVLEEIPGPDGAVQYKIDYENGKEEVVTYDQLQQLRNGQNALDFFNNDIIQDSQDEDRSSEDLEMSSSVGKRTRRKPSNDGFVNSSTIPLPSESDESAADEAVTKKRRIGNGRISLTTSNGTRQSSRLSSRPPSRAFVDEESSDSELNIPKRRSLRPRRSPSASRTSGQSTRGSNQTRLKLTTKKSSKLMGDESETDELADDMQQESEGSDIVYTQPSPKKRHSKVSRSKKGRRSKFNDDSDESMGIPKRQSSRVRITKNMKEQDMDEEIYADDVAVTIAPKVISIREIYQPISKLSPFRIFHNTACDVCNGIGTTSNKGSSPLIYCQGCSTSIHKICLGYRSGRDHMVTKIGHEDFVMQCRRCIGVATKKDSIAPRLDVCQGCDRVGRSCAAFSLRRTAKQEEKLREENDGDDPVTEVSEDLINNSENVLFRCISCQRAYHFEHLPPLSARSGKIDDVDELRQERFKEYRTKWQCKDCRQVPAKVQSLVAWRPVEKDSYKPGQTAEEFTDDKKEYLIKWEEASYFKCTWMPGAWVWGVTNANMRKAFFRRDEGANLLPKWTNQEAVPEEFLRMEIVFDVQYVRGFSPESESADKEGISMVDEVFVKFQGLSYDEAVWEEPPEPEDEDRWSDFVAAYNEYLAGKYFKQQPPGILKQRVQDFRHLNFTKKVELKKQPSALLGGQMMTYQMEGLNWLLYNFHQQKNVILADEMGLGKTIQIISLIATLVKDNPKCWPFLVVTPNSTCPNWRREIKKWAPSLRVVSYYGGKKARDMAMQYELYPDGCTDMRAHVVVTSYEAPVDDHSKSFFRRIKWAGLIVDEGQRLKNDENLLYSALRSLKIPFQVLLTGTPLQNNKRELFNLLQFLDKTISAADLDEEYAELTQENLPGLHELIRPFFLRRTKLQVLKFLPPMAQVILPVTMSLVQKKLYKSILAKNPELIKSIFGQTTSVLRPAERGNLNNILMQLRKCLCHPFLYSSAIEERSLSETALHRSLVDASSKFQLLEIMLPKLRERGHRVLIFSQFLNNLDLVEDFLSGLSLPFQRLDGTIGALEKQKRIDAFNAPDSPLFAFLLSTRAGGVGINLATADTVIIMDPDFNPHQDIQALSRAHRIGQKKKVLVFQLMTKDSAEEKIVQIGRKKMALDQALIESMGTEDDAGVDLESILKHGAEALFNDDDRNDIHYDPASVDKLLDRTQVENTDTDDEKTAESQFSFARVWANDTGTLTEDIEDADAEIAAPNISVWDKILKQRELDAAAEAASKMQTFGRGKRARQAIDYKKNELDLDEAMADSPLKQLGKRRQNEAASDLDFAAAGDSDAEEDSEFETINIREIEPLESQKDRPVGGLASSSTPINDKMTTAKEPIHPHQYPTPNGSIAIQVRNQRGFKSRPQGQGSGRFDGHRPYQQGPGFSRVNDHRPQTYIPRNNIAVQQFNGPPSNYTPPSFGPSPYGHPSNGPSSYKPPLSQLSRSGHRGSASIHPINSGNGDGRTFEENHLQQPPMTRAPACQICSQAHVTENCPLRARDPKEFEECGLCGLTHFWVSQKCPNLISDMQIRIILDRLRKIKQPKSITEPLVEDLLQELRNRAYRKKKRQNGP